MSVFTTQSQNLLPNTEVQYAFWRMSIARMHIERILFGKHNYNFLSKSNSLYSLLKPTKKGILYYKDLICGTQKNHIKEIFTDTTSGCHLILAPDSYRLFFSLVYLMQCCVDSCHYIPILLCQENLYYQGNLQGNIYGWIAHSLRIPSNLSVNHESYIKQNLRGPCLLMVNFCGEEANRTLFSRKEKRLVLEEISNFVERSSEDNQNITQVVIVDTDPEVKWLFPQATCWCPTEYQELTWSPEFGNFRQHILTLTQNQNFVSALSGCARLVSMYAGPWYEKDIQNLLLKIYEHWRGNQTGFYIPESVLNIIRNVYHELSAPENGKKLWNDIGQWLQNNCHVGESSSICSKILFQRKKENSQELDNFLVMDFVISKCNSSVSPNVFSEYHNKIVKLLEIFIEHFFAKDEPQKVFFLKKIRSFQMPEINILGDYELYSGIAYFIYHFSDLFNWKPDPRIMWLGELDDKLSSPSDALQPLKDFAINPLSNLGSALKSILANCYNIDKVVVPSVSKQALLEYKDPETYFICNEEGCYFLWRSHKSFSRKLTIVFVSCLQDLCDETFFIDIDGEYSIKNITNPIGYYLDKMADPLNHGLRSSFSFWGERTPTPDPDNEQFISPKLLGEEEERWQRSRTQIQAEIDERRYTNNGPVTNAKKTNEIIRLQDITARHTQEGKDISKLIILGEGGIGKSFLLQSLIVGIAKQFFFPKLRNLLIPVIFQCIDLRNENQTLKQELAEEICHRFEQTGIVNPKSFYYGIRSNLALFFDALDEAPGYEQEIVEKIKRYSDKPSLIVMTTRPTATAWNLLPHSFRLAQMQRFSEEQINQFIRSFADNQAERIIDWLKETPNIQDMVGNPLFLNMLIHLKLTDQIPESPTELIEEFVEQFMEYEQDYRSKREWSDTFKFHIIELLEYLAFQSLKRSERTDDRADGYQIAKTDIEKLAVNFAQARKSNLLMAENITKLLLRTNLLIPRAIGRKAPCQFAHRIFQDYFAGCYLAKNLEDLQNIANKICDNYYRYQHWEEPLVFAMDIIKESNRDLVFEILGELSNPERDDIFHNQLMLVGKIVGYAQLLDFPGRKLIVRQMLQIPNKIGPYEKVCDNAWDIIGKIGKEEEIPLILALAEAPLKSPEFPKKLPMKNGKIDFSPLRDYSMASILCKRSSRPVSTGGYKGLNHAVCRTIKKIGNKQSLLPLLCHENSDIRYYACEEIVDLVNSNDISCLISLIENEKDDEIRKVILKAIIRTDNKHFITFFLNHEEEFMRSDACMAIENRSKYVHLIQKLLEDVSPIVRSTACLVIGSIGTIDTIPYLLPLLGDKYAQVRSNAGWVIEKIVNKQALPFILPLINDSNKNIRTRVCSLLCKIDPNQYRPLILSFLKDEDKEVIITACGILEQIATPADRSFILPLFKHHDNSEILICACKIIEKIGLPEDIFHFFPLLKNFDLRKMIFIPFVTKAIKKIGKSADKSFILALLSHNDDNIRQHAWELLSERMERQDILNNLTFLSDKNPSVRSSVCKTVGKFGTKEDLSFIFPLLQDEDSGVRSSACTAVGELGTKDNLSFIFPLLQDENRDVRNSACIAIGKLGTKEDLSFIFPPLLQDEDYWTRQKACELVIKLGDKEIISELLSLFQKYNDNSIYNVLQSLSSRLKLSIRKSLRHPDQFVVDP